MSVVVFKYSRNSSMFHATVAAVPSMVHFSGFGGLIFCPILFDLTNCSENILVEHPATPTDYAESVTVTLWRIMRNARRNV